MCVPFVLVIRFIKLKDVETPKFRLVYGKLQQSRPSASVSICWMDAKPINKYVDSAPLLPCTTLKIPSSFSTNTQFLQF